MSGCAHAKPEIPQEPITKVYLPASVPGSVWFCVENPDEFDQPRLHRQGWVCALTVADIRRYVAHLQVAE